MNRKTILRTGGSVLVAFCAGAADLTVVDEPYRVEADAEYGRLFVNQDMTIAAGRTVRITGGSTSSLAEGIGRSATLTLEQGACLRFTDVNTNDAFTAFRVGCLGATGTVAIAAGAVLEAAPARTNWNSYTTLPRFRIGCNADSLEQRVLPSFGRLEISGTLRVGHFECGAYFPRVETTNEIWDAAEISLNPGGLLETSLIGFNDQTRIRVNFRGGTLRCGRQVGASEPSFLRSAARQALFTIDEGCDFLLDTAGQDVFWRSVWPGVRLTGAGGLVKRGAGRAAFALVDGSNDFSGAIRVEEGSLALGRALLPGQTVFVCAGAEFLPYCAADLEQITWEEAPEATVYRVETVHPDGIDLTSFNGLYRTDALAGSLHAAMVVTGAVVHGAVSADAPFTFFGTDSRLTLVGSGLVGVPLRFASGRTRLAEQRIQGANAESLRIDSGAVAEFGSFLLSAPDREAVFSLTNGASLSTSGGLFVGYDGGTGTLVVADAALTVASTLGLAWNTRASGRRPVRGRLYVTNSLVQAATVDLSAWGLTNSADLATIQNEIVLEDGATLRTGKFNRHDDAAAVVRFRGGRFESRDGGVVFVNGDRGTFRLQGEDGNDILWHPLVNCSFNSGSGRLETAGDCDFVCTGAVRVVMTNQWGTIVWNHTGDTRFDGVQVSQAVANLLPNGGQTGRVVLENGATLDLAGRDAAVNTLAGDGHLLNSGGPAVLSVGADGRDATFDLMVPSNVTLRKTGTGTTTTVTAGRTGSLAVEAGRLVLQSPTELTHYRFKIEKALGADCNSVQLSELRLLCDGEDVTGLRSGFRYGSEGWNHWPVTESPGNLLDGSLETKYLDFRLSANRLSEPSADNVWVQIDYPGPQRVTHYTWATANDQPNSLATSRDPASWRFQGSLDGANWFDLDVVRDYPSIAARTTWVGTNFTCCVSDLRTIELGDVSILPGSELVLEGYTSVTCDGIRGNGGTITFTDGGTLRIAGPSDSTLSGTALVGVGTLVKDGEGELNVFGETGYEGSVHVKQGTLVAGGSRAVPDAWWRFTFKQTCQKQLLQLSELWLCGLSGSRVGTGLRRRNDGTAAADLAPGEVAMAETSSTTMYYSHEGPEKLFDADTATKMCLVNNNMADAANSDTWRTVVFRLPEAAEPVTGYLFTSGNDQNGGRDPVTWTIESSADGVNWTLRDEQVNAVTPGRNFAVFNGGAPYPVTGTVLAGGTAFAPNSPVTVDAGATLDLVGGSTAIGVLSIDLTAGAGSVTAFTPAPSGELRLANLPAGTSPRALVLPISVGVCSPATNLSGWTVSLDGVPRPGVRLLYADGRLVLAPRGLTVFLR